MVRAAVITHLVVGSCAWGGMFVVPVATAAPNDRHMGVSTCASSVCHGAVTASKSYDVLLNEYVTWSHSDKHSKAFAALHTTKGREIAARLGIDDPALAKDCLDCHSDNVPLAQRGEKFSLADGVGCESCHGGAERWLTTHTSAHATYRDELTRGMFPTADLQARTQLCLSCHYGNAQKFATHRMMAAGHPRLSFELETFLALQPPHYSIDESYRKRKPAYGATQIWAYGQLAAAAAEMDTLQGVRLNNGGAFPELALFNCYGCHTSSMRRNDWSHRVLQAGIEPGTVPISDGHLVMAWIIARVLEPQQAPELLHLSRALLAASSADRGRIVERSRAVGATLKRLREAAASTSWTRAQERELLMILVSVGTGGEFRDYVGAEQAVMGIDGLLIHLGAAKELRPRIDELYALTQNDEAFVSERFVASLRQLREQLEQREQLEHPGQLEPREPP